MNQLIKIDEQEKIYVFLNNKIHKSSLHDNNNIFNNKKNNDIYCNYDCNVENFTVNIKFGYFCSLIGLSFAPNHILSIKYNKDKPNSNHQKLFFELYNFMKEELLKNDLEKKLPEKIETKTVRLKI